MMVCSETSGTISSRESGTDLFLCPPRPGPFHRPLPYHPPVYLNAGVPEWPKQKTGRKRERERGCLLVVSLNRWPGPSEAQSFAAGNLS